MESKQPMDEAMKSQQSIDAAAMELGMTTLPEKNFSHNDLIDSINYLINHQFEKLISILYRIDVNENKIRNFLANTTDVDAATIIAALIIERETEKIASRKQYSDRPLSDDDESW